MIAITPWALAVLIALGISHKGDSGSPYPVSQLCGKLVHVGKDASAGQNVKGVAVELYRRTAAASCCEGASPLAKAITGHWGSFRFKKADAGPYWIVAHVGGHEYQMAIQYEPKKDAAVPLCSKCFYEIHDSGEMTYTWTMTVTVD